MKNKNFTLILSATLFFLTSLLAAQDLKPQSNTPNIDTNQKTYSALKSQENNSNAKAKKPSASTPEESAKFLQQGASYNTDKIRDEGTEYWPRFWGVHLKITDSLLALLTFLLVLFTGLLWRSTEKLWTAGERQIDVARRSADVALDALSGNRAWMLFDGFQITDFSNATGEGGATGLRGMMLTVKWKNFGATPAIAPRVVINTQEIQLPIGDELRNFEAIFDSKTMERSIPVAPGAVILSDDYAIFSDKLPCFECRKFKVIIYSKVVYFDIYKPDVIRETEICLEVFHNGFLDGDIHQANLRIRATGPQNTAS